MTIELTPERALELMREVVAEYGEDYVYADTSGVQADGNSSAFCVYADAEEECPSCLVGHALFRAGVTIAELVELDESSDPSIKHAYSPAFTLKGGSREVFAAAQEAQDNGAAWGVALAEAERRFAQLHEAG